jgi:hypothetical protein
MLPKVNQEGLQWTDCEVRDAINLIYQNLLKLDSYLSELVRVPMVLLLLFFVEICVVKSPIIPKVQAYGEYNHVIMACLVCGLSIML